MEQMRCNLCGEVFTAPEPEGVGPERNVPESDGVDSLTVIPANCFSHGRRHFVDVANNFPAECRFVPETLSEVYDNDRLARERGLSLKERLALHQELSSPLMEKLKTWIMTQLDEKLTEPDSGLGQAMRYILNHWSPLTLFLRKAGAPLDNNICYAAGGITSASRHSRRQSCNEKPHSSNALLMGRR